MSDERRLAGLLSESLVIRIDFGGEAAAAAAAEEEEAAGEAADDAGDTATLSPPTETGGGAATAGAEGADGAEGAEGADGAKGAEGASSLPCSTWQKACATCAAASSFLMASSKCERWWCICRDDLRTSSRICMSARDRWARARDLERDSPAAPPSRLSFSDMASSSGSSASSLRVERPRKPAAIFDAAASSSASCTFLLTLAAPVEPPSAAACAAERRRMLAATALADGITERVSCRLSAEAWTGTASDLRGRASSSLGAWATAKVTAAAAACEWRRASAAAAAAERLFWKEESSPLPECSSALLYRVLSEATPTAPLPCICCICCRRAWWNWDELELPWPCSIHPSCPASHAATSGSLSSALRVFMPR